MTASRQTRRLGDFIDTLKGFAFKSKWYSEAGTPIVKVSNFTTDSVTCDELVCIPEGIAEKYRRYALKHGDVVVQTVGSWPNNPASVVGKAVRIPLKARGALLNQNAVKLIPSEDLHQRFFFYLLRSSFFKNYIVGTAQGAASQASITLASIREFRFSLPEPTAQRRIASILSSYDDLIENNHSRIRILEEIAQNLYREWFVKFRFPGHEKVNMVDSPLGEIPEGWAETSLEEVADVFRGRSYKSSELVKEGGLPFVNLKCIDRDGGYRASGLKRYDGAYKEHQTVVSGDIVMAVTDMTQERRIIARAARLPRDREARFVYSMDLVKIVARDNMPNEHLYALLRYSSFPTITKEFANGANVLHLSPKHISEYRFPLPPQRVMGLFCSAFAPILRQTDSLLLRNAALRQTRELLLPKLMSGKLDVSKLDIEVPEEAA